MKTPTRDQQGEMTMPTYATIAQRIAEAKRRGCKVQKTVSGHVYDPDNMVLYDPDHDADCKSHGVSIVEPEPLWPLAGKTTHQVLDELPVGAMWKRGHWSIVTARTVVGSGKHQYAGMVSETTAYFDWPADAPDYGLVILSLPVEVPPTRVRCWKWRSESDFWAMSGEDNGIFFSFKTDKKNGDVVKAIKTVSDLARCPSKESITPAAALDLLKDWPEGRAKLLQYFRDHPPLPPAPPPLAPCPKCGGECRLHIHDASSVVCSVPSCNYGFGVYGGSIVRLADHPVRTDRTADAPPPVEPPQPAGVVVTRDDLKTMADAMQAARRLLIRQREEGKRNYGSTKDYAGAKGPIEQQLEAAIELAADARRKAN